MQEVIDKNYNLDFLKLEAEQDDISKYDSPEELIIEYENERNEIIKNMDEAMANIKKILDIAR